MKLYFFLFLFGLSLQIVKELPKYGTEYLNSLFYLYLNLSDFKKGESIFLEVSFRINGRFLDDFCIDYIELNTIDEIVLKNPMIFFNSIYPFKSNTNQIYNNIYNYTSYFQIVLEKKKYLIIKQSQNNNYEFYVKHIKEMDSPEDSLMTIFLVIFLIMIIIIIIIIFICKGRRKKNDQAILIQQINTAQNINHPTVPVYQENRQNKMEFEQPFIPPKMPYYE